MERRNSRRLKVHRLNLKCVNMITMIPNQTVLNEKKNIWILRQKHTKYNIKQETRQCFVCHRQKQQSQSVSWRAFEESWHTERMVNNFKEMVKKQQKHQMLGCVFMFGKWHGTSEQWNRCFFYGRNMTHKKLVSRKTYNNIIIKQPVMRLIIKLHEAHFCPPKHTKKYKHIENSSCII